MIKKLACFFLCILIVFINSFSYSHAKANRGVDRSKLKKYSAEYPATLIIGNMSFDGKLGRGNNLTDEDMEKAIKETLEEYGLTELEIGDLEYFVEKVEAGEKLTPEEIQEIWDNILSLFQVDTLYDLVVLIVSEGQGGKSPEDFAVGTASDWAQDQAFEIAFERADDVFELALEGAGKEAASVASTLFEAGVIIAEQYEKDKEKWKKRANALNTKRFLKEFYDKINEKIDKEASKRGQNWTLDINDTNYTTFAFYGIEGNRQTWKVNIMLKKPDSFNNKRPGGTYTGVVQINIEYNMSEFDNRFLNDYLKNYDLNTVTAFSVMDGLGAKWVPEYKPTEINRYLYSTQDISINIPLSDPPAGRVSIPIDLSELNDDKTIKIDYKVTGHIDYPIDSGARMIQKSRLEFKSNDEEKINYKTRILEDYIIADGEVADIPPVPYGEGSIPWDDNIWKQWEKEKTLVINCGN